VTYLGKSIALLAVVLLAVLTLSPSAQADPVTLITSRAALGTSDSIDWSQGGLFPPFRTFATPPPQIFNSALGAAVMVSKSGDGIIERRDQDGTAGGWVGNFNNGDALLWSQPLGGTLTLDFGQSPISAGGANIQSDFFGNFTARIEAFDASGKSLGSFTEDGVADTNVGTAIFLGVASDSVDIAKITFTLDFSNAPSNFPDFAINSFSFTDTPLAIPEPGSLALLGLSLLGVAGYRWRCRRAG
jgi:hypothetical protein